MSSASTNSISSASARDTSHLAKLSLPNILLIDFLTDLVSEMVCDLNLIWSVCVDTDDQCEWALNASQHSVNPLTLISVSLGCIYTKAKATSFPICCIVFNLCVYTTAMCKRQKIKEKNRFRSNINEPFAVNLDTWSHAI